MISESLWKTLQWIPEKKQQDAAKTIIATYVKTREIAFPPPQKAHSTNVQANGVSSFEGSSFDWYSEIREGLSGRQVHDPLVKELVKAIDQFEIPHQFVFDFIRGVDREKSLPVFPDFDELRTWAYLTSSSLWLCVIKIVDGDISDDQLLQATIDLGVLDTLLEKLSDFVPQMETKNFFLSRDEWIDRRLNLENQVEPIDHSLWRDLIQFQCKRLELRIANAAKLGELLESRLGKKIKSVIGARWALLKKIRRNPELLLRQKIELDGLDRFRSAIRSWLGINSPKKQVA
jgi:phytoene/squalene synthetase